MSLSVRLSILGVGTSIFRLLFILGNPHCGLRRTSTGVIAALIWLTKTWRWILCSWRTVWCVLAVLVVLPSWSLLPVTNCKRLISGMLGFAIWRCDDAAIVYADAPTHAVSTCWCCGSWAARDACETKRGVGLVTCQLMVARMLVLLYVICISLKTSLFGFLELCFSNIAFSQILISIIIKSTTLIPITSCRFTGGRRNGGSTTDPIFRLLPNTEIRGASRVLLNPTTAKLEFLIF